MEDNKKSKKLIIIVILVLIFAFGAVVLGMNWTEWFGEEKVETVTDSGLQIDPNAGEYVAPTTVEAVAEGIAIPGWGSITIPAGQTDVTVDFPNPEANDGKYYLSFELKLKDTGEVLYKSGLVEPGLHIQHITLSRALVAGEYDAVVHVQPYKMDKTQAKTNNADMETKLIVVNPE